MKKLIIENRTRITGMDALSLVMEMMEDGGDRRGGVARKFDRDVTVHASSNDLAETFVVMYSEGK